MLNLLQKTFKEVFIYIAINTQSKRVLNKNQEFVTPKDIMRFGAKFFVSPTGSRHLGEMKPCTNDCFNGHQGTLQFSENGERSL